LLPLPKELEPLDCFNREPPISHWANVQQEVATSISRLFPELQKLFSRFPSSSVALVSPGVVHCHACLGRAGHTIGRQLIVTEPPNIANAMANAGTDQTLGLK